MEKLVFIGVFGNVPCETLGGFVRLNSLFNAISFFETQYIYNDISIITKLYLVK